MNIKRMMYMFPFSISTWSMRESLGPLRWTVWNEEAKRQEIREEAKPQELELADLPEEARQNGLGYLEVCHFQFPSTDEAYLLKLKDSFEKAGVGFLTLLVDYGDISSPDEVRRDSDIAYLRGWIDVAAKAGAQAVRIVAGSNRPAMPSPSREAAAHSGGWRSTGRSGECGSSRKTSGRSLRRSAAGAPSWTRQAVRCLRSSTSAIFKRRRKRKGLLTARQGAFNSC
ncbi:sugar phosphate isomerase/epimerase [Paenibacillus sp. P26]|nr:sugar phosphate isomerase/epimerase [Paenibacillus sp. P26]